MATSRMRPTARFGTAGALLASLLAVAGTARADEPVAAREPRLMSETAEITSVVDAFDEDDPFDLNLILGFSETWKHAKVRRESQVFQPGLSTGGFVPATENVGTYSSNVSTLLVGADIGLYKDLALLVRLPVILDWSQSIEDLDGSAAVQRQVLQDPAGGQIFGLPFHSPSRSGIDYVSAGIDWAIFNQRRDRTKPTWVVGVEGRLAVGTPLHACNANPAANVSVCPDPVTGGNRDPGISRGMDSILAKTLWSKRVGYMEPYTGLFFQADFPTSGSDFAKWNPSTDAMRMPPMLGTFAVGLEVVPYERPEQFQRLSADFRFAGTYHSAGRDYSELFDALGSSQSPSLRTPNAASFVANPNVSQARSIVDPASQAVYFTGITEQQAYGSFTLSAGATWQAGDYVKFTVGSALTFAQSHLVTAADACNPNVSDPGASGPCRANVNGQTVVTGVPNPDHRDAIDLPGRRFVIDESTAVDLFVMGVVMF